MKGVLNLKERNILCCYNINKLQRQFFCVCYSFSFLILSRNRKEFLDSPLNDVAKLCLRIYGSHPIFVTFQTCEKPSRIIRFNLVCLSAGCKQGAKHTVFRLAAEVCGRFSMQSSTLNGMKNKEELKWEECGTFDIS